MKEIPSATASTVWDRDGDGPEEPMLIIAAPVSNNQPLIGWNGERWFPMTAVGDSIGLIQRLFVYNNKLHAFTGRLFTFELNRWVETAVAPVRPTINDLTIFNNEIVIAGQSGNEKGVFAFRSGTWVRIGAAFVGTVASVDVWNDNLVAAGMFSGTVATFDGTNWTSIGPNLSFTSPRIRSIGPALVLGEKNGPGVSVYRDGRWTTAPGSGSILDRVHDRVYTAESFDEGQLRAFDGTIWTTLDSASREPASFFSKFTFKTLAWYQGRLHAVGDAPSSNAYTSTLEYVGSAWRPFGEGTGGRLRAAVAGPDGSIYVANGWRSATNSITVDFPVRPFVRRWNGVRLAPVGPAFDGPPPLSSSTRISNLFNLQWDPEFGLLAVGYFYGNNRVPITAIARNVGDEWLPLGSPLPTIRSSGNPREPSLYQSLRYRGELLAIGIVDATPDAESSGMVRYLNGQWVAPSLDMQLPFAAAGLYAATVFDDKLFVAGSIRSADFTYNSSAIFDGQTWSQPDNSVDWLADYCVHNNELYAISREKGATADTFYITRWTGSGWQRLSRVFTSAPYALASYSGQLYVGGAFGLLSWNGTLWSIVLDGGRVADLVVKDRELIAVGDFSLSGSTENLVRYTASAIPSIASNPRSRAGACGDNVSLAVVPSPGYSPITYKWSRNGSPINDGTTAHGSSISGSATDTLRIANLRPEDAGSYTCSLTGRCGTATTSPAAISASCCPADLDQNGAVADEDFQIFAAAYDLVLCASPSMPAGCPADFTADTIVDDADFAIFVTAYDRLVCP
ncbi:MAG: immunoglobulin domain-containing protein [Phycisphaerales bacterium]|nr:immunoglobulin domain-containing protein [Phycisphaerales bacterium]